MCTQESSPTTYPTKRLSLKVIFVTVVICLCAVGAYLFDLHASYSNKSSYKEMVCMSSAILITDFYIFTGMVHGYSQNLDGMPLCNLQSNTSYIPDVILEWEHRSIFQSKLFHLTLPHLFVKHGFETVKEFTGAFCIIGALITYSVCRRFMDTAVHIIEHYGAIARISIQERVNLLQEISGEYGYFLEMMGIYNKIWGFVLLTYFIDFFPCTTDALFEYWDNFEMSHKTMGNKFRDGFNIMTPFMIVIVAAEGSRNVRGDKQMR